MTISVNIHDSSTKRLAKVSKNRSLDVNINPPDLPLAGSKNRFGVFIRKMDTVGDGTGTTNQGVNGSVTNVSFFLNSNGDDDLHIILAIIALKDSAVSHDKFGAINALTNGWDFKIRESGVNTDIMTSVKTGGDLILQSALFDAFGTGAELNEVPTTGVSEGAQVVKFNFGDLVPGGLRLGRSSLDRLECIVKDDLTGLIDFNVLCMGYSHVEL